MDVALDRELPCFHYDELYSTRLEDLPEKHTNLFEARMVPMARALRTESEEEADEQDARGFATRRETTQDSESAEKRSRQSGPSSSWQ